MRLTRRAAVAGLLAAPAILRSARLHAAPRVLKISHQFPAGTIEQGDFRDRLVRRFAAEVQQRTNGDLAFEIYAASSLVKTVAQFSALRHGTLDVTLYPLAYAGGEVPEVNIGLMPCLVSTYQQAAAWKTAEVGRRLTDTLEQRGVKIVTWIWQSGGVVSRAGAVVRPDDVKGLKVRGGSREMDLMLKGAGGVISAVPSNEIFPAMRAGALDAAVTSSTSLISFRLEQIGKAVTSGIKGSFWFMFEPLLMSKSVYDALPADQQKAISEVGTSLEAFALEQAKADDIELAKVFGRAGANVAEFDAPALQQWRDIARDTAWKDFAARGPACAELLALAEKVPG